MGSLGRPSTDLIRALIRWPMPENIGLSIAGGEIRDWTSDLDQSIAGILPSRFFLKIALAHSSGLSWRSLASRIASSLRHPSQLILGYYADFAQADSPAWRDVVDASTRLGSRYVLMDTCQKARGRLLDYHSASALQEMISWAHQHGLRVALAGSLRLEDLSELENVGADWLGMRGALCKNSERTSELCPELLRLALSMFPSSSRIEGLSHVIR